MIWPITRALWLHRFWLHPKDGPAYAAVLEFLACRVGGPVAGGEIGTICAFAGQGRILSAVLFHNWQPQYGVIEISGAGSGPWLSRDSIADLFGFAFEQMGAQAVVARMDEENPATVGMLRFGFTRHDIPRLRGRDKAETLFVLTDDAWLKSRFRKEKHHGKQAPRPD